MTTTDLVEKLGHSKSQCLCTPGSGVLKFSVTARRLAAQGRPSHHYLQSALTTVAEPDGTLRLWTASLPGGPCTWCVWIFLRWGSCWSPDNTCSKWSRLSWWWSVMAEILWSYFWWYTYRPPATPGKCLPLYVTAHRWPSKCSSYIILTGHVGVVILIYWIVVCGMINVCSLSSKQLQLSDSQMKQIRSQIYSYSFKEQII